MESTEEHKKKEDDFETVKGFSTEREVVTVNDIINILQQIDPNTQVLICTSESKLSHPRLTINNDKCIIKGSNDEHDLSDNLAEMTKFIAQKFTNYVSNDDSTIRIDEPKRDYLDDLYSQFGDVVQQVTNTGNDVLEQTKNVLTRYI